VTRSSWLDPTGVRAALGLSLIAALANGVWILLDHSTPSWDQSHYLTVALQYQHGFEGDGPLGLLRAIHSTDPSHGPLFTIALLPFLAIFGPSGQSGLILNLLLAPVLYIAAGQIAWLVFRSWAARLLTIVLVAAMPLMVGLFHNNLQDFLLVTIATLSILLLLLSERFQRPGMSIWLGLAMGLGTLTKVTFPLFMVGPLLVIAAQVVASRRSAQPGKSVFPTDLRRLAVNLGYTALVYLAVTVPWYLPNFEATREYVNSTTGGPLALGAGPSDPFTFHAITSFTTTTINANVTWVIALAGLIAVLLNGPALLALLRRPMRIEPLLKLGFLIAWVLVPFLSVALAHNQDVRLMAPAMPGMAVIAAGAIAAIRWPKIRLALTGVTAVALLYLTLGRVTPISPSFLPEDVSVQVSSYNAAIPLAEQPIGYERLPERDYGTPVIDYIAGIAEREGVGATPKLICLLESEPIVNSNSLGFLALAHEYPLAFADIAYGDEGRRGLRSVLEGCDYALYVRQPQLDPAQKESRLALVNEAYAASYMTPRLFGLFAGPSRTFPVAEPLGDKGEARYLSTSGSGSQVTVLVKRPLSG